MRRVVILAVAVLFAAAVPSSAQEKFSIKLKELGEGESLRFESREESTYKNKISIEKEKEPGKTQESSVKIHVSFVEQVLERPDPAKRATRLRRIYEKADYVVPGVPGEAQRPYAGKTVLIEKIADKYAFRIEFGKAVEKDPLLEGEFNGAPFDPQKRQLLPTEAVAVGDTWKLDTRSLLAGFDKADKVDIVKQSAVAKLVKVYKKDGRTFGVIESETLMKFAAKFRDVATQTDVSAEQLVSIKTTFDGCIDGSWSEGKVTTQAEFGSTTVSTGKDQPAATSTSTGVTTTETYWVQQAKK